MSLCVKVWGDYACFTRPEMKVERFSYDVITPSAARGILSAIYWKPEFNWLIRRIHVMKPVAFIPFARNEVSTGTDGAIFDATANRVCRSAQILRHVEYYIEASFIGADAKSPIGFDEASKHTAIFKRRAEKGACFARPYLGCREYAAHFELVDHTKIPPSSVGSRDLGLMFYDFDYVNNPAPTPKFFHATMNNGVINVPVI